MQHLSKWEIKINLTYFDLTKTISLRGDVKKNSIFKDIVQIGGGEVNPMSKIWKEMNFWQKLEREGVTKHIVKNRSTLFCMIYYSVYTTVP